MFFVFYLFFLCFFLGRCCFELFINIYILYIFFSNFYLFFDQCWKTVCPPRPFIKCLKVLQFSTNWPGSSHWVTARRTKKNLYNLPRCFAKITDFKKRKKKEFIKYPPKWALYTRTWLALYRPLNKGGIVWTSFPQHINKCHWCSFMLRTKCRTHHLWACLASGAQAQKLGTTDNADTKSHSSNSTQEPPQKKMIW